MTIKTRAADATAGILNLALRAAGRNFRTHVVGLLSPSPKELSAEAERYELVPPRIVEPAPADMPLIERIAAAYRRAKQDQRTAPAVYRPSSLWQHHLDTAFAAVSRQGVDGAARFLTNFAAWPMDTGIEGSTALFYALCKDADGRERLREMFDVMLRYWRQHEARGRPVSALTFPRFGSQCGVLVDGAFVGYGAVFADVHSSVLRDALEGVERPVIAEVGGGWAKVVYMLTRKLPGACCYVDFDLPEPLCCAAYYFMKAYPNRRVLLYGEADLTAASLRDYDLIFLPSFAIDKLPDDSADLFVNKNSLGEMLPDTTRAFVAHIARTTRGWFWHLNHEFMRNRFEDGSQSLICPEYELPSDRFRRVHRYVEIGHMLAGGGMASDIYGYLYQRT